MDDFLMRELDLRLLHAGQPNGERGIRMSDEEKAQGTCAACDKRPVAKGESASAKAARKLGMCSTCYTQPSVRRARRAALGLPERGRSAPARAKAPPLKAAALREKAPAAGAAAPDALRDAARRAVRAIVLAEVRSALAEVFREIAEGFEG